MNPTGVGGKSSKYHPPSPSVQGVGAGIKHGICLAMLTAILITAGVATMSSPNADGPTHAAHNCTLRVSTEKFSRPFPRYFEL